MELALEAHLLLARMAENRAKGRPSDWIEGEGRWFSCPTGERFRIDAKEVLIVMGPRIGISMDIAFHSAGGHKASPETVDRALALMAPSLAASDLRFRSDHGGLTAIPFFADDRLQDARASRMASIIAVAATQADPAAPWTVTVQHPLIGGDHEVYVRCTAGLERFDLEPSTECLRLVEDLPKAHSYSLQTGTDRRGAAQRRRRGLPLHGWFAIMPRMTPPVEMPESDVLGTLRAMADSAEDLAEARVEPAELLDKIDIADDEFERTQTTVRWIPPVRPPGPSPLAGLIPAASLHPIAIIEEIGEAVAFSWGTDALVYRWKDSAAGTGWRSNSLPGMHIRIPLQRDDLQCLTETGMMMPRDDGSLELADHARQAAIASRIWSMGRTAGPVIPGMRMEGADGSSLRRGWIVFDGAVPSFHSDDSPRETRTAATRRLLRPRRGRFMIRGIAIGGGAWLDFSDHDASIPEDDLDDMLPDPWRAMMNAGWKLATRTMETVFVLEAILRDEPDHDISHHLME